MRYFVTIGDRTVEVDLTGHDPVIDGVPVQAQLSALGINGISSSNPDQAKAFVASEVARWTPVVQRLGIAL